MRNGTFYLNNRGNKWIILKNGKKDMQFCLKIMVDNHPNGFILQKRKADYYEQFGNYAVIVFRRNGKKYRKFPQEDTIDNLPVVIL